jgi:hypothetical protein
MNVNRLAECKAPTLRIEYLRSSSTVNLTWTNAVEGWVLESTDSLEPANWQPVPELPVLAVDHWEVSQSTSATTRFYRLRN